MKRLLKYELVTAGDVTLALPIDFAPRWVGWQQADPPRVRDHRLVVWAEADDAMSRIYVTFHVRTTGSHVPAGTYIGSAQLYIGNQPYVVHVYFELGEPVK